MNYSYNKKSFDEVYELKRKGMWGYKWHRFSLVEKWVLIFANSVRLPRFIWALIEKCFPQISTTNGIKCICNSKGVDMKQHISGNFLIHYFMHHL